MLRYNISFCIPHMGYSSKEMVTTIKHIGNLMILLM